VRVVRKSTPATSPTCEFDGVLRIAVVLGAAGLPVVGHWDAIQRALRSADFNYRLLALVASDELAGDIEAVGDANVEVDYLQDRPDSLIKRIASFGTQVLYVFAHGVPGSDDCLQMTTRGAVLSERGREPNMYVSAAHFRPLRKQLWIAVFNACNAAAPDEMGNSLAFSLVADGLPAAIGMREEVSSEAAEAFCETFFDSALRHLSEQAAASGRLELDWGSIMNEMRLNLCIGLHQQKSAAGLNKEWTLPVLYLPPWSVPIRPAEELTPDASIAEAVRDQTEVEELKYQIERLPHDVPADRREIIEREIDRLQSKLATLRAEAEQSAAAQTGTEVEETDGRQEEVGTQQEEEAQRKREQEQEARYTSISSA
jgi:hypothetical protein